MLVWARNTFGRSWMLAVLLAALAACSGEGLIEEVDTGISGDVLGGTDDFVGLDESGEAGGLVDDGIVDASDVVLSDAPEADLTLDESVQPDTAIDPPAAIATCELQQTWVQGSQPYAMHYADASMYSAPDGLEFVVQSAMSREFFDPATGAELSRDGLGETAFAEGNWTVSLSLTPDGVVLTPAGSLQPSALLPLPSPNGASVEMWMAGGRIALNQDSSWAAAVVCWRGKESDSTALLGSYSVEKQTLAKVVDLQQECEGSYWQLRPLLEFAGAHVVARLPESGMVHVVHVSEPEHYSGDLAAGLAPAPYLADPVLGYVPESPPVVRIAVSPDKTQLAVVTHDARIRFYKLPQLELVGPVLETALLGVNMATYGPTIASPLGWSHDGTVLAHLSVAGGLALSDARNGELLASYPNLQAQPLPELPITINPPIAFRILEGSTGIVVAYEWGRQRLDCR